MKIVYVEYELQVPKVGTVGAVEGRDRMIWFYCGRGSEVVGWAPRRLSWQIARPQQNSEHPFGDSRPDGTVWFTRSCGGRSGI